MSLELSGPDASRSSIEAAKPEHPSLLDPTHQMDALFGVVNVPNVIWIDENGVIVRPAEPGWPGPTVYPAQMIELLAERVRRDPESASRRTEMMKVIGSGQDRGAYPDAIRDWAVDGAASRFAMTPDEVIAACRPRDIDRFTRRGAFRVGRSLVDDGPSPGRTRPLQRVSPTRPRQLDVQAPGLVARRQRASRRRRPVAVQPGSGSR